MNKMYQTSDEGMRKIRIDQFRKMSVSELEAKALEDPFLPSLAFDVLEETYQKVKNYRERKVEQKAWDDGTHWMLHYPDAGNEEGS